MHVLVRRRDPGESSWYFYGDYRVVAETKTAYKLKLDWFQQEWFPKRGTYYQCELVEETNASGN